MSNGLQNTSEIIRRFKIYSYARDWYKKFMEHVEGSHRETLKVVE